MKRKPFNPRARKNELLRFWALLIKTRDQWRCQECGCTERRKLQAAHVFGKKQFPFIQFWLMNGITLCWHCHFKADKSHRHQFTLFCMDFIGNEKFYHLIDVCEKKVEWGPDEYTRALASLNDKAVELGVETT